jgi:hypothetical protein
VIAWSGFLTPVAPSSHRDRTVSFELSFGITSFSYGTDAMGTIGAPSLSRPHISIEQSYLNYYWDSHHCPM